MWRNEIIYVIQFVGGKFLLIFKPGVFWKIRFRECLLLGYYKGWCSYHKYHAGHIYCYLYLANTVEIQPNNTVKVKTMRPFFVTFHSPNYNSILSLRVWSIVFCLTRIGTMILRMNGLFIVYARSLRYITIQGILIPFSWTLVTVRQARLQVCTPLHGPRPLDHSIGNIYMDPYARACSDRPIASNKHWSLPPPSSKGGWAL